MAWIVRCSCGVRIRDEDPDRLVPRVRLHAREAHDLDLSPTQVRDMMEPEQPRDRPREKERAMKTLACGDLVPGCPAVVEAETEEEILAIAAQHAVEAHGLEVNDELVAAVKSAIRDAD